MMPDTVLPWKAVIFDADGVILDTEGLWDQAQQCFLERRGIPFQREPMKHQLSGRAPLEAAVILKNAFNLPESPEDISRERLDSVKSLYQKGVSLIPGFHEFFSDLPSQMKRAVASSMDTELLELVDRQHHLRERFHHHVYVAAHVGNVGKPNPDLFLYAAAQLNVPPDTCLVIEDAPQGIEAARRAGMTCVALTTTYPRERLLGATVIAECYTEVTRWLQQRRHTPTSARHPKPPSL